MDIYIPYVYLLKHTTTGYYYFGSKYGRTTKTNPDTFWVDYFTSSKTIHKMIEEYGYDCWTHEILYVGEMPIDVLNFEKNIIENHIQDDMCLNVMVPFNGYDPKDIAKTRKVPDKYGMTSYDRGAIKAIETKLKDIKDGKNNFQRSYYKAIDENPELPKIRGQNSKKTMSYVNPETGLNKYQENGKLISGENNPSKIPENAKKISNGRKKYISNNKEIWNERQAILNKKLDTVRDKDGLTARDRHSEWMKTNNPASGSKWYNNGIINKRIKEGDVIPDGFVLGRVKSK